jgi:hypothetical protein
MSAACRLFGALCLKISPVAMQFDSCLFGLALAQFERMSIR